MRFKIDENLPVEVADLLAAEAHDAVTVTAQGLQGTQDATLAQVCQEEDRILVTLDVGFAVFEPIRFEACRALSFSDSAV